MWRNRSGMSLVGKGLRAATHQGGAGDGLNSHHSDGPRRRPPSMWHTIPHALWKNEPNRKRIASRTLAPFYIGSWETPAGRRQQRTCGG